MKKISEKDWKALSAFADTITEKRDAILAAFEDTIKPLLDELNEARDEARDMLSSLAEDADSYFDDRSENWQEGEKGEAYSAWKDLIHDAHGKFEEDISLPNFEEFESDVDELLSELNDNLQQEPDI